MKKLSTLIKKPISRYYYENYSATARLLAFYFMALILPFSISITLVNGNYKEMRFWGAIKLLWLVQKVWFAFRLHYVHRSVNRLMVRGQLATTKLSTARILTVNEPFAFSSAGSQFANLTFYNSTFVIVHTNMYVCLLFVYKKLNQETAPSVAKRSRHEATSICLNTVGNSERMPTEDTARLKSKAFNHDTNK